MNNSRWLPIFAAMFLLMVVTVATPFGTTASVLLPDSQMQLIKLLSRATAAAVLLGVSVYVSYRKNAVPYLIRFFPLIVFGTWAILSCTWSGLPKESFNQGGSFGILILLSFVVAYVWDSDEDTEYVLKVLSGMLMFVSCALLAMYFLFPQFGALTRSSNGLFHSTAASASASLGFLIVLLSKLIWNWKWTQKMVWANSLLQIGVVLISANRFSLAVTTLIAGLAIATLARKDQIAVAALSIGLIGTAYLLADPKLTLVESGLSEVGVIVSQGQTSSEIKTLSGRTEMWEAIWRSFKEAPWKGHGYFVTSKNGEIYVWYIWGNWTAHNAWLQVLVTTGIIGTGIFCCHLLMLAGSMIHLANQKTAEPRRILCFFLFMGGWYSIWGLLNSSIFGPTSPETVVFFVLTGLFVASSSSAAARSAPTNNAAIDFSQDSGQPS